MVAPLGCWETCTKELYDLTKSTGRYSGFENGPPCEVRALGVIDAAPQASEAVRNAKEERFQAGLDKALEVLEHDDFATRLQSAQVIRALKTQADKDGGGCAKGAGEGDLHFIAGTIVLHLKGPVDPAGVIAASRAIKAWIDRQQRAALSPTQPTEQGERDGSQ
jgi:hypothetical protein